MCAASSSAGVKGKGTQQENWKQIQDARERKKVQNRIAQRSYRERTRKRLETLEQLCRLPDKCTHSQSPDDTSVSAETSKSVFMETYSSSPSSTLSASSEASLRLGGKDSLALLTPTTFSSYFSDDTNLGLGGLSDLREKALDNRPLDMSWDIDACIGSIDDGTVVVGNTNMHVGGDGSPGPAVDSNDHIDESLNESMISKFAPFKDAAVPSETTIQAAGTGETALHLAAESGNVNMLQFLLQLEADVLARDGLGRTALHVAVEAGKENAVLELLKSPCVINAQAHNGQTALHVAASLGNERLVGRLLIAGSNVDVKDAGGRTSLHLAVSSGHHNVLKTLVENGANINARIEL